MARSAVPRPGESSSLVTARSAVPSPGESSSLVMARSAVPSPGESSSLVMARSAIPSPRESSSLVMARSAVPSLGESALVQEITESEFPDPPWPPETPDPPSSLLHHWSRNGHRPGGHLPCLHIPWGLQGTHPPSPVLQLRCGTHLPGGGGNVTVNSSTALHFPASLWSLPCTQLNHSHLTSIREFSSPVSTNQALYKTALIPNTHCLVSCQMSNRHLLECM